MDYRVVHRTIYTYETEVSSSYGQLHLHLRDRPGQVSGGTTIELSPRADDYRERLDFFGNRAAYFSILRPHRELVVTATSAVAVTSQLPPSPGPPWDELRDRLASHPGPSDADGTLAGQFVLASPLIEPSAELAAYARLSFPPGRPIVEAVADLAARIHAEFDYEPGATTVTTPLHMVLAARKGVCQDFAHLAVGCLRSMGLAARYVSGYLETIPPSGQTKLAGADESHAWVSVFTGDSWVDVDPTNDQLVDGHHITAAWGRDYGDVAPLTGVIFTQGSTTSLDVQVDVTPLSS